MQVLYLEHGPLISGGQRSLLELLRGLPPEVVARVACPPGPLEQAVRAIGVPVDLIPGTHGSFKLHPLHTPRMLIDLARMARAVRRLTGGVDVIHANSVRAGLVARLASPRTRPRPKVVVHVRDSLPHSRAGNAVRRALAAADCVIAISEHTARTFGRRATVVHNPIDAERFRPRGERTPGLIAVVGQITPWKGQDLAIRVAGGLREAGRDVHLLVVGEAKFVSASTRYDNRAFERELHVLVKQLGLSEHVEFLGEREDVEQIMARAELVLVPSWEEPFGRTVVEAMATGACVIATREGGPPEIVTDGLDGVLLPPREPGAWTRVAAELLDDPERRERMGAEARSTVLARFTRERHVARVMSIYRALLRRG